ncbi:MAG: MFS transporter [Bryobacterales bacterium]|nr:MFS transporter [Bryobacterales bacterium]
MPASPAALSRHYRWWIVTLLFLSTVINYIDRQTLSVLAPLIKTEQGWNNQDFGLIVISFRIAYTIGQSLSGRMVDRLGTRRGLSLAVAWYSIVAMATPLATGLRGFCAFRFLLGLGESANWPAATKAVSEWFPKRERALAVGIFDSGSSIGAALAPAIVLGITAWSGNWRWAFVLTGSLGFLWLLGLAPLRRRTRPRRRRRTLRHPRLPRRPHPLARPPRLPPNLGRHRRPRPLRPRLVLHHRLVRHLPHLQRLQTRGKPPRLLGPLPLRRPRQLRRRRPLQLLSPPRLERRMGPQGHLRPRRLRHGASHPRRLHQRPHGHHRLLRRRDILLRRRLHHRQHPPRRPLRIHLRSFSKWPLRHRRRPRHHPQHLHHRLRRRPLRLPIHSHRRQHDPLLSVVLVLASCAIPSVGQRHSGSGVAAPNEWPSLLSALSSH